MGLPHRTLLLLLLLQQRLSGGDASKEAAAALPEPVYRDPAQPIDVRTADLLGRMTLDEKIAQLTYVGGVGNASTVAAVKSGGVGGLQCGENASTCLAAVNQLQAALQKTRLGIPASIFAETTHSGGFIGSTVFPMPVTTGCSWNTSLLERIGAAIALEARAAGIDQALGPILQVCTDPRFGRMEENFGEDPFHVSQMGVASTQGLQGRDCGGANVSLASDKVSAQAKHFAICKPCRRRLLSPSPPLRL
jgi:beta-glucosidase